MWRDGTRLAVWRATLPRRCEEAVHVTFSVPEPARVAGGDPPPARSDQDTRPHALALIRPVAGVTGGEPREVPTDHGLVQRFLTKDDYRSVAPPAPPPGTPSPPS
jgi:hypothetical protein